MTTLSRTRRSTIGPSGMIKARWKELKKQLRAQSEILKLLCEVLSHRIAVGEAKNKPENASREVNNSMLASDNGKVFCEVVGQFLKSDKELKEMEKNVMDAKRTAANAVSDSEQVLPEAVTMDKVVKDVVTRLRGDYLTLVRKFPMTSNLDGAAGGASEASVAANASVRTATGASTTTSAVEKDFGTQRELLKFVQTQLANMSNAAGTKDSDVTFEACDNSVSELLKKKSTEAICRIAEFNMTLLHELNITLQEIGSTANAIARNLSDIGSKVKEANSSAHDASLLAKQATENVKKTIARVQSGVVANVCGTLSELRAMDNKSGAFSPRAANTGTNISEWVARVDAIAKESDGLVDLSGSVEGAFATAGKRLEVLKRVLHRADEQRGKVVGELAGSVAVGESSGNDAAQVNTTLRGVLVNATSRVSAEFSKDACKASLMSESLKLLSNMTNYTATMNSLQVAEQLTVLPRWTRRWRRRSE
ncbi:hypothetical protein ERJ75_001693600 [Trypanosoma vivax]|nr:hypothetical protein ERJ75_001693600 [Trypanosoma vivax]